MMLRFGFTLLLLVSTATAAHEGHGDQLPWQACTEAVKNAPCEYSNSRGDIYSGHCKRFSGALMCVRNKPIVFAARTPASALKKKTAEKTTAEKSTTDNTVSNPQQ